MSYWVLDSDGNRQTWVEPEITDFITMITPDETPILARLAQEQAGNVTVQTLQDDLDEGEANASIAYGDDYGVATSTTPGSLTNYIERFSQVAKVNNIEQAVKNYYGIGNLLQREEGKKLKAMKMGIEKQLLSDAAAQQPKATNDNHGKAAGLAALISTHADGSTSSISTGALDNQMQSIQDDGGNATEAYCSAAVKKAIDALTTNITRNTNDVETLHKAVRYYDGSFGRLAVHYHRFMPQDVNSTPAQLMLLQMDMIRLRPLHGPKRESLPNTGSGPSTAIEWPVTWDILQEKALGIFTAL